jgi:hypothetical protein
MKRIFSVLAVTALMVAMLVASVSPVLAKNQRYTATCVNEDEFTQIVVAKQKKIEKIIEDVENVGFDCTEPVPI